MGQVGRILKWTRNAFLVTAAVLVGLWAITPVRDWVETISWLDPLAIGVTAVATSLVALLIAVDRVASDLAKLRDQITQQDKSPIGRLLGFLSAIKNVQRVLRAEGLLTDSADGVLGPNTFAALEAFQARNELGDRKRGLDAATIHALFNWNEREDSKLKDDPHQDELRRRHRKPPVDMFGKQSELIQRVLRETGHFEGKIDGVLRSDIMSSVIDYQAEKGIEADGTIGAETVLKLLDDLRGATWTRKA